jgi:DNA-binding SARP family transcriptional activator/tetratricopeptide (TPR) repeat protein
VELRLLGPVRATVGADDVPLGPRQQRLVLAVLALEVNQPVPVDRLVEWVWPGDDPPRSAAHAIRVQVSKLRAILANAKSEMTIATAGAGYQLCADPRDIDAHQFLDGIAQARLAADDRARVDRLDRALRLWTGPALADTATPEIHDRLCGGLEESRLVALEDRFDAVLRLGGHQEALGEITTLVNAHPTRERLVRHLMLALHRGGQTTRALDVARRTRAYLAEELGIDPGPELQRLELGILRNDPDLLAADTTRTVVPRQLPPPAVHFAGRADELRHLDGRLETSGLMVISAIGGTAGVGKTALAVHWGHRHADRFPDGQLYVNLRGFDPAGEPMPPADAVRGFLTALGVPAQHIPGEAAEQVALYRSHLADRRMLVVLDNARDAEQVRPLLPGAPGCLVVVTSRDRLAGLVALDGAVPLTLDLLTQREARDLLIERLGRERVERDAAVVDELIELCARLPLAVNIAAAHATLHPTRPLATLVAELRDAHRRLDTLSAGEAAADVRAVFSWSYRTLSPEAARMFRLLGLHPGPDVGLPAAASLVALDQERTVGLLGELIRAHLIAEPVPGRYTFHDLLRAYAADQANAHDNVADRDAALRRLLDFYTHTAHAAERLLAPQRLLVPLAPAAPGAASLSLVDGQAALEWFDTEHANLMAAQHAAVALGWHDTTWQLAWNLATFHLRRGLSRDDLAVWQAADNAAAHLPDPVTRARIHRRLGVAYGKVGRHADGIGQLEQALSLAGQHGVRTEQAYAHYQLSWAWMERGDDRQAILHATEAAAFFQTLDLPEWEASAHAQISWCLARLGEYDKARLHSEEALRLDGGRTPDVTADAHIYLGYIDHHTGRHAEAVGHYRRARDLLRSLGHVDEYANTLDKLGHPHVALGQFDEARAVWLEASELYRQQNRAEDAERVRRQLAGLQG